MNDVWIAAIAASVPVLIALITALVPLTRAQRRTEGAVAEVHQMVNSAHDEQLRYQAELAKMIRALGGTVPDPPPPPRQVQS